MSALIPFDFEENAVRVVMRDETPWFVASDVCRVLEIGNSRDALTRLDDDEKGVGTTDTLGGKQQMNIINESGLYVLIFSSRKEAAKRFRKWVTSEVLPALRRTGRYEMEPAPDPFAAHARRVGHVADHLNAIPAADHLALRASNLPIWSSGRRPPWWSDLEVRTFLIRSHRQMSTLECERIGAERFGPRCPKKSAICSLWLRLDRVLGPKGFERPARATQNAGRVA